MYSYNRGYSYFFRIRCWFFSASDVIFLHQNLTLTKSIRFGLPKPTLHTVGRSRTQLRGHSTEQTYIMVEKSTWFSFRCFLQSQLDSFYSITTDARADASSALDQQLNCAYIPPDRFRPSQIPDAANGSPFCVQNDILHCLGRRASSRAYVISFQSTIARPFHRSTCPTCTQVNPKHWGRPISGSNIKSWGDGGDAKNRACGAKGSTLCLWL